MGAFTGSGSATPLGASEMPPKWGGQRRLEDGSIDEDPTLANDEVRRLQNLGAIAANRRAPELADARAQSEFSYARDNIGQAAGERANQQRAQSLMASAARGNQPSQAESLGQGMIDRSLNAQLSGAASARGGALGQAAAMRAAANNAASQRAEGTQQLSALRANEMAQAREAYMGSSTGIRGQDLQTANQRAGMANQQADIAKANATLVAQQRQLNQQGQQFAESEALGVRRSQLAADTAAYAQSQQGRQFDRQQEFKEDESAWDKAFGIVGGLTGMFTGAVKGKATGGPIAGGNPYLVGERGPEIVVPSTNGVVVPADTTRQLMSGSPPAPSLDARMALSPDDLRRSAAQMEAEMVAEHAARMASGSALKSKLTDAVTPSKPGPLPSPAVASGGGIIRENPYGEAPTDGGIVRENPYGEAQSQSGGAGEDRLSEWMRKVRKGNGAVGDSGSRFLPR
jgi:hypothetical protein